MKIQCSRDEGMLVINAYRVCQERTHNPGAFTVYTQQHADMRAAGVEDPNPRKQILKDIAELINENRKEGWRPIVMMDANGDTHHDKDLDQDLVDFLEEANLKDPYYDKFPGQIRTYLYGNQRLDYIWMDEVYVPAIKAIGYLETHQGALADHPAAYVDFYEDRLFQGVMNRPIPMHSREFIIEQDDKVEVFVSEVIRICKVYRLRERVFELCTNFAKFGKTKQNVAKYQQLDKEIREAAMAAAKKTSKKKFGYMRSPELTTAGQMLIMYKMCLDCSARGAEPTTKMIEKAKDLELQIEEMMSKPTKTLRKEVRKKEKELWKTQKECEQKRYEWLKEVAQARAKAAGDEDWEKRLRNMEHVAKDRAVNRKLTAVMKGKRGELDRIEVATHDWFFSEKAREIYHYDAHIWEDVTKPEDIERLLLARNKRHLEQTDREKDPNTAPIMDELHENFGINEQVNKLLDGRYETSHEVSEEMAAWIEVVKMDEATASKPPIVGVMPKEEYQKAFGKATEKTSSNSTWGYNYSIWKAMAANDYLAEFQCIMISLPFMYGFANVRWLKEIDFMLEKKKGIRMIHILRIIGLLEADFNTALKYFYSVKMMIRAEEEDLSDEQWGSRKDRTSIDASMIKLITYENARTMRTTMAEMSHDARACFDRMIPAQSNIYCQRQVMDKNLLECTAKCIEGMNRHVKVGNRVSEQFYCQDRDAWFIGGEVQGKGDVPP
ncbi:hypothetical protein ACHAWF_002609, partial [Thalassiosira exigua]